MLDPLPPDIRFERLLPHPEDLAFSFAAKKEALGPHIRARWPWDEDYQSQIHRERFAEKPFFRIRRQTDADAPQPPGFFTFCCPERTLPRPIHFRG
jgi:hypothetical protein